MQYVQCAQDKLKMLFRYIRKSARNQKQSNAFKEMILHNIEKRMNCNKCSSKHTNFTHMTHELMNRDRKKNVLKDEK